MTATLTIRSFWATATEVTQELFRNAKAFALIVKDKAVSAKNGILDFFTDIAMLPIEMGMRAQPAFAPVRSRPTWDRSMTFDA